MRKPTIKDRIIAFYWVQKNKLLHKLLLDLKWDFGEFYMDELEIAYQNYKSRNR